MFGSRLPRGKSRIAVRRGPAPQYGRISQDRQYEPDFQFERRARCHGPGQDSAEPW